MKRVKQGAVYQSVKRQQIVDSRGVVHPRLDKGRQDERRVRSNGPKRVENGLRRRRCGRVGVGRSKYTGGTTCVERVHELEDPHRMVAW
jgi:hypothetical protein